MPDSTPPSPPKPKGDDPKRGDHRPGDRPPGGRLPGGRTIPQSAWLLALLAVGLGIMAVQSMTQLAEIDYRFFWEQVDAKNVSKAVIQGQSLFGEFKVPPKPPVIPGEPISEKAAEPLPKQFLVTLGRGGLDEGLRQKLIDGGVYFRVEQEYNPDWIITMVWLGLLIAMGYWLWTFARRTRDQMVGGGGMLGGVTRSPARLYEADENTRKTFDDVAGLKGVKRDLQEIVEFLKEPESSRSSAPVSLRAC